MKLIIESDNTGTERHTEQTAAFIAAVNSDDKSAVTKLIANSFDLNRPIIVDGKSTLPLMVAAGQGALQSMRIMLIRGAVVNAVDDSGLSALDSALSANQDKVVDLLLSNGAKCTYNEHVTRDKDSKDEKLPPSYLEKHVATTSKECFEQLVDHIIEQKQEHLHSTYGIMRKAISSAENFGVILKKLKVGSWSLTSCFKQAIEKDAAEVCDLLLNERATNIDDTWTISYEQNKTITIPPLLLAIYCGSFNTLKILIKSNRYELNKKFKVERSGGYDREYTSITPLNFSIQSDKLEIMRYLCSLPKIDINTNSLKEARDKPVFLTTLLLHDSINIEEFKLNDNAVLRVFNARSQLCAAYADPPPADKELRQLISQSYTNCTEVIYNRVISLIEQFLQSDLPDKKKNMHIRFIYALLSLQAKDKNFKGIAELLGVFIHGSSDSFPNQYELSALFFQVAIEEYNARRLLVSCLLRLAGENNSDRLSNQLQQPLSEQIKDDKLRPLILRGLAIANLYRYKHIDKPPEMSFEDLQLLHDADPEPLTLMWDCVQYYASTKAATEISSLDQDKAVAEIIAIFENISNGQNITKTVEESQPSIGRALSNSLSGLLAEDDANAEDKAKTQNHTDSGDPNERRTRSF
jgi:ankyrin repeat protein